MQQAVPEFDIFEHGIKVVDSEPPPGLLRIATTRLPIYSSLTVTAVDADGASLNQRAAELLSVPGSHAVVDYFEERDVRYTLQTVLYHLDRVVSLYGEKCSLFEQAHPAAVRGNVSEPRIYFEVDALLGAARRVYEAVSRLLWKHYRPGQGGRWNSIKNAVASKGILPPDFHDALRVSWSDVGESAKDYRDCLMHHVPLTDGQETCWMGRYGEHWGATVRLPADPGTKSRKSFNVESGPDALVYCHGLTAHLVWLCEEVARQDKIAHHLLNPPRYA